MSLFYCLDIQNFNRKTEKKEHLGDLHQVNLKLSLCLTKYYAVKTYGVVKL